MAEPRIVSPEEAQQWERGESFPDLERAYDDLVHTVATERERHEADTRAAVVKALRQVQREGMRAAQTAGRMADAIENGADW